MHKWLLLAAVCVFSSVFIQAQDTTWLTQGLSVAGVHHYGREALYTDQLAYQLYNNRLPQPVAGVATGMNAENGSALSWQAVQADSLKRFRGRSFGGGYLYFSWTAEREKNVLLNITGAGSIFFNGVIHAGDPYASGWLYLPVQLKKGLNELYVRVSGPVSARIITPAIPVAFNTEDATLPYIVAGQPADSLLAAVVVINASAKDISDLQVTASIAGKTVSRSLPAIPRMSTRKCIFQFNGTGVSGAGKFPCELTLLEKGKKIDESQVMIESVGTTDKYSSTFISAVDGSLQYYAVTPQVGGNSDASALFLSVHGAGVEAIGQAKAYHSKNWGTLVAATNRRPRGFNWEDWGRLDALEVLALAKEKFKPDPRHIYLTGHSMGGHGTWFLGATYPDKWAAIGACSGYPTLKEYGSADGAIPAVGATPTEQVLLRASNQSDVVKLASNYKNFGVYILHGDSDKVVPVKYARQMKNVLAAFHADYSYYEYPNGEHWFGDQSVDWPPLFEYFKWHEKAPDSSVHNIDFTTASPGISSSFRWAAIWQQQQPLDYSRIQLSRNLKTGTISGSTHNVHLLQLALDGWQQNTVVHIALDSLPVISYTTRSLHDTIFLLQQEKSWTLSSLPDAREKGPARYGTFKDPFNYRMLFVYGTRGNKQENEWSFNKARYDAETWYYRGNGAVDIIADRDYQADKLNGRNIIIYGNANTNSAYNQLLEGCPIRIAGQQVTIGETVFSGDSLAAYFVWPMKNSRTGSVGVVGGTGLRGMQAANANQYFAGASGFPDFMLFSLDMLHRGSAAILRAGFFDQHWKLVDSGRQ